MNNTFRDWSVRHGYLTSGQRQPEEDADDREQDPVHDSLGRLTGQMDPLPADAVDAVEDQLHIIALFFTM